MAAYRLWEGRCIRRKKHLMFVIAVFLIILTTQLIIIIYLSYNFNGMIIEKSDSMSTSDAGKLATSSENNAAAKFSREHSNVDRVGVVDDEKTFDSLRPCTIMSPDAKRAIKRAKTIDCKLEIANLTCLNEEGKLYPTALPRYCVKSDTGATKTGSKLGCYELENKFKIINPKNDKVKNYTSNCINSCFQGGYRYAAVSIKDKCLCGNDKPDDERRRNGSSCEFSFCAEHRHNCSDRNAFLFATGIIPRVKNADNKLPNLNRTTSGARVVFLLTLNGRAVRQIRRLLRAIYRPRHYYYIHIDERQSYLRRMLRDIEDDYSNVKFTKKRYPTMWGGTTLLTMLLNSIKELLDTEDWKWDFVTNISESDFPIKPIEALEKYLAANPNKNFVRSHGYNTHRFIKKQGLDKTFHQCDDHMWRVDDRKLPDGIVIDGGSDWIGLSRSFCEYVIRGDDKLLNGLKTVFNYTLLPAETFFHTLLENSRFCNSIVDNNLRVTNWRRSRGCRCQYKHIVDWCGCSPSDFTTVDWAKLRRMEDKAFFFARKYEAIINQEIINRVEESIGIDISKDHPSSMNSYWQSDYHHSDSSTSVVDSKLSAYRGLSRLSTEYLKYSLMDADRAKDCSVAPGLVKEATTFNRQDSYRGTLIQFEAYVVVNDRTNRIVVESLAKPKTFAKIFRFDGGGGGGISRLRSVEVGSDYDVKENVFRNFARIIGPDSDPCVETRWDLGNSTFTVSMVWIDPTGTVAVSYDTKINPKTELVNHKPTMRHPLRPGEWMMKLVSANRLAAQVKFVVLPVGQANGESITDERVAVSLNGGPGANYTDYDFGHVETAWGSEDKEILATIADDNAKKHGVELVEWIDELIAKYFVVEEICFRNDGISESSFLCSGVEVETCGNTAWSSLSPDPKSEFHR